MRKRDAGVTLIEMLVVLSIIAIASGALMLRFAGRTTDDPVAEAALLADAMTAAAEAALVSGNPQAVVYGDHDYRILSWQPGSNWQDVPGSKHVLNAGLHLARLDGQKGPLLMAPGGVAEPSGFVLASAARKVTVQFDGLAATVAPAEGAAP